MLNASTAQEVPQEVPLTAPSTDGRTTNTPTTTLNTKHHGHLHPDILPPRTPVGDRAHPSRRHLYLSACLLSRDMAVRPSSRPPPYQFDFPHFMLCPAYLTLRLRFTEKTQ